MRYLCAMLLAAALALSPAPAYADQDARGEESVAQPVEETGGNRRLAALIIGGTLAMVSGMWISLYKRGKK